MKHSTPSAPNDRGSVVPLVAIGMVLMLIMAAFAIDLGNARQAKGLAQSATDSAALAGAATLGGVTNGATTPPTGVSQAVWDAASWAFKNMSITTPTTGTKPCDGIADKTCFSAGDAASTRVEVTTPYTSTKTSPTGTAYIAANNLHVKTCWNNATFISSVIGISTIRVCSEATANVTGPITQNNDDQDDQDDPYALCDTQTALFDTTKWFPGSKATKDIPKEIPGKNEFGATYDYPSDLVPSSVKITIGSVNAFVIGGQASATVHVFDSTSPWMSIVSKGGTYKYEIKFKNYTGAGGTDPKKNFKDYLPDGVYTFAVYAESADGHCNQTSFAVTITSSNAQAQSGVCQEDLFRGGTSPASGTQMGGTNGYTIRATFYDETRPFVAADDVTDATTLSHEFRFWIKGGTFTDFTDQTTQMMAQTTPLIPATGDDGVVGHGAANPGGSHEYQWKQIYQYVIPSTYQSGEYTFKMRIYDSDQNKSGGDCGYAIWTVNFVGVGGVVQLIE